MASRDLTSLFIEKRNAANLRRRSSESNSGNGISSGIGSGGVGGSGNGGSRMKPFSK